MEWIGEDNEAKVAINVYGDNYTIYVAEFDGTLRILGEGWKEHRCKNPKTPNQECAIRVAEEIATLEAREGLG